MQEGTGMLRRLISAALLVLVALPMAATGVSAQTTSGTGSNFPPSSIANIGSVSPAVAFNMIGTNHTVTFTCGALAGLGTATLPAGCYDVQATVQDITTGSAVNIQSSTCGITPGGSGTSIDCSGKQSPICPTGTVVPGTTPVTFTGCTPSATGGVSTDDTASVTINPGANHAYVIQFTGYVPPSTLGSCPTGTTATTISLTVSLGIPPTSFNLPSATACQFTLAAQKKYVEITNITATVPTGGCGGALIFAEGLKSFFGPSCTVTAVASGTVVLKTGVNCTDGSEPATGTAAPTEFGPNAKYACVGDTLSVTGVTGGPTNTSLPNVDLAFTSGGVGSFNTVGTVTSGSGSFCAGAVGATTATGLTGPAGVSGTLCPTGPGTATVQVCLATPLPNNQPQVCSATLSFTFTQFASRVVPYVRWSGEKIELTKCFGVGLSGMPVEFVLKGNNPGLNATLIPVGLAGYSAPTGQAGADTVWTTTDQDGCASVIGLADGEGAMYVDAAIFNATAAGAAAGVPLVNEHAFDVFYLKFDHLDLENIKFATYSTAQALLPYLSWASTTPAINSATIPSSSFTLPGAPGTGQVAGAGPAQVALCAPDFVRAMVHGYFEISGDPSGRPAATVAINGAPTGSAGSYVLPAGRWVLPEDWPLLATFAGFSNGTPLPDNPVSSVFAWDLNSGWVFNPTGEGPDLCGLARGGGGIAAGLLIGSLTGGGTTGQSSIVTGAIPVGALGNAGGEDIGPCFGQDVKMLGTTTWYGTAPGSVPLAAIPGYAGICGGGVTAGFGPFDATRSCTDPFPLTFTPAGAAVIGVGAAACGPNAPAPCLAPVHPDSTYLPNGTLNQWDAPMPPAEISFAITSGPGSLAEVDKTSLYQVTFDTGAPGTSGCGTGYTLNSVTGTCQLELDPDPFYAEAIPASPLIPPVTNNGGYLWNSWNFSAGITTVVRSSPAIAGVAAGGFVPGQSTTVTATGASFPGGVCPTLSSAPGTSSCSVAGGLVLACSATPASVVVADGRGFMAGMTLEGYDPTDGDTLDTGVSITAVLPNTTFPAYPNAMELQLSTPLLGCTAPGSEIVIAEQFGLPVPGAAAFVVGQAVTIGAPGATTNITETVTQIDTTNNIVYVNGAEAIASTLGGGCVLSRPTYGACEPATIVPPGTVLSSGPVSGPSATHGQVGAAGPPNLYPFWQWVPAAPAAAVGNTTATVYSDNHGESVVALNTNVSSQAAPVNGACTAPFLPIPATGPAVTCLLPFATLGTLGFGNVAAALSRFSASNPGCIQTFPSGTFAVVAGATVGATGPAAGQICVNSLGGIEFGAAASLGTTTVQAVADYPYTRGEHPPISSAPLVKVFTSAFAKTLTVSAGTPGPAGTTSYVVTITAQDVCGRPLVGEPIQVYALGNAGAAVLAPISAGSVISASSTSAVITVNPADGTATLSLEVLNTAVGTQGLIVKAVFSFERIERFATVISGTTSGQTATVVYAPGWQQVGGPAGSNFSVAEALFAFDAASQTYTNATAAAGNISSAAPGCTGYWAYFAAAMAVSLPATSHSGDTATCTLAAGWNLVGNPFATPAKLPSGVTAFHWNGTSYDTVGVIPTGGSVWIFNDGTLGTVTLTAT